MRRAFKFGLIILCIWLIYEIYSTIFNHSIFAFGLFGILLFLAVIIIDQEGKRNARQKQ